MFPTTFGNPSDPDTFSHLFSKLAQGTPLHVVSDVLGHASIAITKDVYGHLMEGDKRAATEAISGSAGEIQAGGSQGGSHRGGRHRVTMESTKARDGILPVHGPSSVSAAERTRTPNLLIRSQFEIVYQRPRMSGRPAQRRLPLDRLPQKSALVQGQC
jgi:hypothetical protein